MDLENTDVRMLLSLRPNLGLVIMVRVDRSSGEGYFTEPYKPDPR